ncbi:WhiB family transcriptional regulator [Streptomyces sp. DT224]|uniref:WhiB family transcriptional regulator n=1 Tax=Streptomyces sp. DT224 TaxID=3393426 RepID=UPI003CEA0E94
MTAPDFMRDAPCGEIDPEAMFPAPTDKKAITFAKHEVCGNCPARLRCLEWALDPASRSRHGIFGGLTERERSGIIRARKLGQSVRLDYGTRPPKSKRLPAAA